MIRIAIVGKIGSGKTFVSLSFGLPVFNADLEVSKIYKKDRNFFKKLKKRLPNYIKSFPIEKRELQETILKNSNNLKKITNLIHPVVRKKMLLFLKKNKKKKGVVLDIPLYFENKINKKSDIIVFVDSKQKEINRRLQKRSYYNKKLLERFKKIQLKSNLKRKKSNYIIKNNFKPKIVIDGVKALKGKIFSNEK